MPFTSLLNSFIVMMALVAFAVFLRRRSVIEEAEQGVFARLVTDFALPAVILANVSREPLELRDLELALILLAAIALVMAVAWRAPGCV